MKQRFENFLSLLANRPAQELAIAMRRFLKILSAFWLRLIFKNVSGLKRLSIAIEASVYDGQLKVFFKITSVTVETDRNGFLHIARGRAEDIGYGLAEKARHAEFERIIEPITSLEASLIVRIARELERDAQGCYKEAIETQFIEVIQHRLKWLEKCALGFVYMKMPTSGSVSELPLTREFRNQVKIYIKNLEDRLKTFKPSDIARNLIQDELYIDQKIDVASTFNLKSAKKSRSTSARKVLPSVIILEALRNNPSPMHKSDLLRIVESSGLKMSDQAFRVCMSQQKAICSFGESIFGLYEKKYDPEPRVEDWIYQMLTARESMLANELEAIGIAQGFTPNELRIGASLSQRVCFSRAFSRVVYQTKAFANWRRFETWFSRDMLTTPPEHSVLLEGFRRMYQQGGYQRVIDVAEILTNTHKQVLPTDLEDFVVISRSRVI